ncbi:MAG TPA: D-alanyl-D-alanine carboxypeptidase [Ideonella sp.]|uniref:D-alanyl-D-alanine carboxypeptidase/D-alanyl-D-alanine-endopeptidase n=1 Tax=Ideonella sp. TaxID=1929293 RepID=UPI002E30214F|nr:D-alanyl-D-alanine carboxypeptidase [Ideonella sp.]HEX5687747.1 D-alanyl-D-alanine carboxypeptidase [Ideonella sp.]
MGSRSEGGDRAVSAARGLGGWLASGLLALAAAAQAQSLPGDVDMALKRAKLPANALAAVVQEVGSGPPLLTWNEQAPVNPASLFKLVTTFAALDQLGPAWTWTTPVYLTGPVRDGVLDGSVVIQGRGDPKLVVERVWLLLRRLQQQAGVREIRGDIVLDHSAFAPPVRSPGDFDGEPHKPQNVQPDALLLNYKSVSYSFVPEPALGFARVAAEPMLAGVQVDATVPLVNGPCDDWRATLKAQLADPLRVHFAGSYPLACGERNWPLATADPQAYGVRLVDTLWRGLGGRLGGSVRVGVLPEGARLAFDQASPPLAEVIRDINKFSNNVMAEQLFLSLPAAQTPAASAVPPAPASAASGAVVPAPVSPAVRLEDARDNLRRWLAGRFGDTAAQQTVIDNGSGLSREVRISPLLLARLLQAAWASSVMPELMSSLPISGTDGTLKRSTATAGRAHLKTGSLRDVAAVAGYVLSNNGRRYVLVAIVNHPNAATARPALDALVQWTIRDGGPDASTTLPPPPGACCMR